MNYKAIITKLFFILIHADGRVDEKETYSGNKMIKAEALDESEFNVQLEYLKSKDQVLLLLECLSGLKRLDRNQQIRIMAWLCVVANADGFMDTAEWKLIYKIYHKELNLPLDEIFIVQKQLNALSYEKFALLEELKIVETKMVKQIKPVTSFL